MALTPFDLSFEDLVEASAHASKAARREAEIAGVPIPTLNQSNSAVGIGWTDERIVLLKNLWLDGLSGSQMAKQLGGVTRSAVLNKVHRLGLSGHSALTATHKIAFKSQRIVPQSSSVVRHTQEQKSPVVLTLGAHMCKWPVGDPATDGFSFCGRRTREDGPYCDDHARLAYQPQQKRSSGKPSSQTQLEIELRRRLGS